MKEQIFKIKKGDTLPTLQVNVSTKGNLGQSVEYIMTGCSSAHFTMVSDCGKTKIYQQDADISNGSCGIIKYHWADGDTDTPGTYYGEFHLTFTAGTQGEITIPQSGGIKIEIFKGISSL